MNDIPGGIDVVEGHGISNLSFDACDGKGVSECEEMGVNFMVVASLSIES